LEDGKYSILKESFRPYIEASPFGFIGESNSKLAAVRNGCFYWVTPHSEIHKLPIQRIRAAINESQKPELETVFKRNLKCLITDMQFNKKSQLIFLSIRGGLFRPEHPSEDCSDQTNNNISLYEPEKFKNQYKEGYYNHFALLEKYAITSLIFNEPDAHKSIHLHLLKLHKKPYHYEKVSDIEIENESTPE